LSLQSKAFKPDIPVIWGGVHPTLYPDQVAQSEYVDYVVKGEGESITVELLDSIKNGTDHAVICSGDGVFDINTWQYPMWDLFDDIKKIGVQRTAQLSGVGLPLVESRHCPHRCAFCINPVLKGKYRYRPAKLVIDDITKVIESGVRTISFYDEDFFANKKRLVEVLDLIETIPLKFQWFGTSRADYFRESHIDRQLLQRIKNSGCIHLGIGAESGSQQILDMLKKDITVEDTVHAAELLSSVGINADFSFMIGMPDETYYDMKQTVSLIERITKLSQGFRVLGPFIYRPYPGSELYQKCLQQGMKEPGALEEWVNSPFINDVIKPEDYKLYTWVNHPMGKLQRLIFYCWLAGMRIKNKWITRLMRYIGQLRCRKLKFGVPVEMKAVDILKSFNIDRLLSKGKF